MTDQITPEHSDWPAHCAALTQAVKRTILSYPGAQFSPRLASYVLFSAAFGVACQPGVTGAEREWMTHWAAEAWESISAIDQPVESMVEGDVNDHGR